MDFKRLFILLSSFFITSSAIPQEMNGFRLDNALIPLKQIHQGGPPRDGIPSIDNPKFIVPKKAWFMDETDRVIGVLINGIAKAYPIKILDRHEIVNDKFGDLYVVITYCPLCGSGVVFEANINGQKTFGVSGLLYNSDVLLYDRQTESLWSQLEGKAISGPMKNKELTVLPASNTTFRDWKKKYPQTLILSTDTGKNYDYVNYIAYHGYAESDRIWFPVEHENKKFPPKSLVAGIRINCKFKAYPFSELKKQRLEFEDEFQGESIKIIYDHKNQNVRFLHHSGKEIPSVTLFWFAWYAFHPDTEIYQMSDK